MIVTAWSGQRMPALTYISIASCCTVAEYREMMYSSSMHSPAVGSNLQSRTCRQWRQHATREILVASNSHVRLLRNEAKSSRVLVMQNSPRCRPRSRLTAGSCGEAESQVRACNGISVADKDILMLVVVISIVSS